MSKINPKISYTLWRLYKDGKREDALKYIMGEDAFANLPERVRDAMLKGKELHQIAAGTILSKGTGVFPVPLPARKKRYYFTVEEKIELRHEDFIFVGRIDVQVPEQRVFGDFKFTSQPVSYFMRTEQLAFYNMLLTFKTGKDTMRKGYYCIWREGATRPEWGVVLFPKGAAMAFFNENKTLFSAIKTDIENLQLDEMLDLEADILYDV